MPRVLLISEDGGNKLDEAHKVLRAQHHVTLVQSLFEAGEVMKREDFDVIISSKDHVTRECVGLLKSIYRGRRKQPVIYFGASLGSYVALQPLAEDEPQFLVTPVNDELYDDLIHEALGHAASARLNADVAELLHALFYRSDFGQVLIDANGIIRDINPSAERILRLNRASLIGTRAQQSLLANHPTLDAAMQRSLESGGLSWEHDVQLDRPDASSSKLHVRVRSILGPDGRPGAMVLVIFDPELLEVASGTGFWGSVLVGDSPQIREVRRALNLASSDDLPITITGEAGSGRRVAARLIHQRSARAREPLVFMDCSTVAPQLLEAELFGGSQGLDGSRAEGKLAEAAGGTLVLQRVTLLPSKIQIWLRESLRKGVIWVKNRDGAEVSIRLVVVADHLLLESVARGQFDEPLYSLLHAHEITMPALRDRIADLPEVIEVMRRQLNERLHLAIQTIDKEVIDLFSRHTWPGNFAELESVLESTFRKCASARINLLHVPQQLSSRESSDPTSRQVRHDVERRELLDTLIWAGWNKSKAARRLGVSRETLYRRLEKFGIEINH